MPCYDPRDHEPQKRQIIHVENPINSKLEQLLNKTIDENKKLMGAMCAIDNELLSRGIAESVYADAQRNGLIEILSIVQQHRGDDEVRLQKDIMSRYSKHELKLIKKLIKQTN